MSILNIFRRPCVMEHPQPLSYYQEIPPKELKKGDSVTFLVRKHKFGKQGWKLMPEDEHFNVKVNGHILEQAVQAVR